jgi:predicted small lipoprotein YifL
MKKLMAVVLSLLCVMSLAGCGAAKTMESPSEKAILTIEEVKELAKKGEDLTWSDFEQYDSEDIGSGLYIQRYDIDESYYLTIGGMSSDVPLYIRLVSADDKEHYIDIRTDSIDDFLNR